MNRHTLLQEFEENSIPSWDCPKCGKGSLSPNQATFVKRMFEDVDINHPEFQPDWVSYVFTVFLKCANKSCGVTVSCTGTGEPTQEYCQDSVHGWDWFEYFQPTYFEPPLKLFDIPSQTPNSVVVALETSFSIFFKSAPTAIGCLRAALEVLLSELGVPSTTNKGKFINLHSRIMTLNELHRSIIEPVTAIKWLGNQGAHGDQSVIRGDVLDGYDIFQHVLVELYPEPKASVSNLVKKINQAKGIDRS